MEFNQIDIAIGKFVTGKNIEVSNAPHSDWLIFDWRQLTWKENGIDYLIEIFPHFDDLENITSWTLYTAASYDLGDKRFYLNKVFEEEVSLTQIAEKAEQLLDECYNYILNVKKSKLLEVKF